MLRRAPVLLLTCVLLLMAGTLHAATPAANPVDPQFSDSLAVQLPSNPYNPPTAFAFTPDGRMLITTQYGKLYVMQNGTLVPTPALDLSAKLCKRSEQGLLGIAVDPDFATNQFIYVYYTYDRGLPETGGRCEQNSSRSPVNRVARFVLSNTTAANEVVLVDNIPSPNGNHNAGDLHFGKDGYLYISTGDGGCDYKQNSGCAGANDAARDQFILLGKILRITRDGNIPNNNPYKTTGERCNVAGRNTNNKPCQETFAWGLRNPFRIAFDPNASSTRFFINDVGQNTWEEIDEGISGADYGWNVREGHCKNGSATDCGTPPVGMTNPIFDYRHANDCNSITAGAFVPNGIWPANYDNTYLYADYVCGKIFTLKANTTGSYTSNVFVTNADSVVTMGFGPNGSGQALYYATHSSNGQIRRVAYNGTANRIPVAKVVADRTNGAAPLTVKFDATTSSDPDGDPLTYAWNFGDGQTSTNSKPTHTFATGTYTVTLTVRDNGGGVSTIATQRIDAGNTPPVPLIEEPAATLRFTVGQTITVRGSATDPQDGALADTQLRWRVILHHDTHTHPFLEETQGSSITIQAPAPEDLVATTNSYLEVELKATDSKGLTTLVTQNIYPNKVNVTFVSEPSGVTLNVNGFTITTPRTLVSWEGYELNVAASNQPGSAGQTLRFDHWADGGTAKRSIITASSAVTYTAHFTVAPAAADDYKLHLPLLTSAAEE